MFVLIINHSCISFLNTLKYFCLKHYVYRKQWIRYILISNSYRIFQHVPKTRTLCGFIRKHLRNLVSIVFRSIFSIIFSSYTSSCLTFGPLSVITQKIFDQTTSSPKVCYSLLRHATNKTLKFAVALRPRNVHLSQRKLFISNKKDRIHFN